MPNETKRNGRMLKHLKIIFYMLNIELRLHRDRKH